MHESQSRSPETGVAPIWTIPGEVKRLKVFVEARFLFVPLSTERVDLGSFLSKFREVGDVAFVPQKIRTLNEDESDGLLTLPTFEGSWR